MYLYRVQEILFRLKRDKQFAASFQSDPGAALASVELGEPQRRALIAGDVATLFRMGVHPLLLAPFSRVVGIARPDYQSQLAPLKGLRRLRSARGRL